MKQLFKNSTLTIAKKLLGMTLIVNHKNITCGGIITETEAYTETDPACHAYKGKKTKRNQIMFKEAGHIYIYFIYGMYYCLNFVTEKNGYAAAVLIRNIKATTGISFIQDNRPQIRSTKNLLNGPAKLVIGLGINSKWNGLSLLNPNCPIQLFGKSADHNQIKISSRIGISKGKELQWRFYL